MQRLASMAFSIALALLIGGCGTVSLPGNPSASGFSGDAVDPAVLASATTDIRFESGDKIRVIVFGEDKLSGEYQVDTGGYVSLPLAGSIKAAGLSKPELETAIAKKLKSEYLRDPRVTIEVMNFRPFYVLGEVQKPGEYPYRNGLNVLSAIAIAGGATYRASTSKVYIQRSGTSSLKEFQQSPTVAVMPGDLVRVPERFF